MSGAVRQPQAISALWRQRHTHRAGTAQSVRCRTPDLWSPCVWSPVQSPGGAVGAFGVQDPTRLQHFNGGKPPKDPAQRDIPSPKDTLDVKPPQRFPCAPIPPCQGGDPPHRNPALAPVHPGTYWSSPTFFTQAISRSDWSWGEQTFHQHPDPHPPAMWERGWWSRTAGSCPVPAPGCPAGASAPPAAARTRP